MSKNFKTWPSCSLCGVLITALLAARVVCHQQCPTRTDEIATDCPDVTNSSLVVPHGSVQFENGLDWPVLHGSNALDGANTRVRFGIFECTEFLVDLPSYFSTLNGPEHSGFSNLILSFKRQVPAPFGFDLSATAGLGFPSGSGSVSGHRYQPYIQFPWSRILTEDWVLAGMFTVTWFTDDSLRNPIYEPTISLERDFGPTADSFIEYVGDYDHQRPTQLTDAGGSWRFTRTQQLDFHVSAGLNRSTLDHYFGIGYSLRLDRLFGGLIANSP